MAIVTTDSANYSAIANAIRSKLGAEVSYYPADMAAAILGIPTGGGGRSPRAEVQGAFREDDMSTTWPVTAAKKES